jgi:F-type H+-transporting ATPase subunit b
MIEMLQDAHAWVAISFAIFAVLAFVLGRGKVLAKLDGRIAQIRREIETAESLRLEAQELLASYQRKQRDAVRDAETMVAAARQHAEQIRRHAGDELNETLNRREQQLEDRLRRMEQAAIQEIRAYAAELAVKATAEIIADKMDEKTNGQLVDQSMKQFTGQLG